MILPLIPKKQASDLVAYAHIAMGFVNLRNSTSCPDDETSTDKHNHFHPIPPPHLHSTPSAVFTFALFGKLVQLVMPWIGFMFVRLEICVQPPSDSTSRWTPLVFAIRSCCKGL